MNREELTQKLCENIWHGMDMQDVHEFVVCRLYEDYRGYTDEEFRKELEDYAPHLLEEETL